MHEMLYDEGLSSLHGIKDGPDPIAQNQYSYDQVTALAVNSQTTSASLTNAQNFAYFALAVRNLTTTPAQSCVHCPIQPPCHLCTVS